MLGLDVGAKLEDPSGVPLKISDTELDGEGEFAAVWEYSGEEELDTEGLPEKLETIDEDPDSVTETELDEEGESAAVRDTIGEEELDTEGLPEGLASVEAVTLEQDETVSVDVGDVDMLGLDV